METTNQSKRKRLVLASRKHQKLPDAEQIIQPLPDRLSDLPDSMLCHILSFCTMKDSVATSILARRWRFIWADVPILDFDLADHKNDDDTFSETINRVMMRRKVAGAINTFSLSCYKDLLSAIEFDTWIRTAVARNVQALDLVLDYQFVLPPCIFTCKSLVDLKLRGCKGIPPQGDVYLPSLKKLHLHSIKFEVDNNLAHLISGCPVLEELIIQNHDFRCNIPSITIERLVLNFSKSHPCDYELEINSPALRYLIVEDHFLDCISAGTLNSLVEADISLYNDEVEDYEYDDEVENDVLYSHSVLEFVGRLCQVKCLTLSSPYVEFVDSAFAALTTRFHNLTKLELSADWRFLLKFLECADNLQVLIIRQVFDYDLPRCWTEPQEVPTCISTHLKQVTIDPFGYPFGYIEDEFEFAGYILKNAKVLKLMKMNTDSCEEEDKLKYIKRKFDATQRILRYSEDESGFADYILKNAQVMKLMKMDTDYYEEEYYEEEDKLEYMERQFDAAQRFLRFERGSEKCKIEFS